MTEDINKQGFASSPSRERVIELKLSELDIAVLLEALGERLNRQMDARLSTKSTSILIQRIYRAIGVKLD